MLECLAWCASCASFSSWVLFAVVVVAAVLAWLVPGIQHCNDDKENKVSRESPIIEHSSVSFVRLKYCKCDRTMMVVFGSRKTSPVIFLRDQNFVVPFSQEIRLYTLNFFASRHYVQFIGDMVK